MKKFTQTWQTNWTKKLSRYIPIIVVAVVFGGLGTILLLTSHAATPVASVEAENGTVSAAASKITDSTASGTSAIKFGSGSGGGTAGCQAAANTPGGSDGLGGCFPGAFNTGYPHGLAGDTRTPVTLTSYTGPCSITTDNTVIDSKNISNCNNDGLFIYAKNVTIKNSLVNTEVYENSDTASITLMDTEVVGGNQYTFPAIGGANNVTAIRVNSHGGEHSIHCYSNCDVEDSWLHDQFEAGSGPHQNGFLSNGGSHFIISHNSLFCATSGCTADLSFTDDSTTYDATIDKNLFVASPTSSYCIDPSSVPSKNNPMYQIAVTNNVFQHGANNKCGFYGPIYGWDTPNNNPGTSGYQNVWDNNKWDNGATLTP